MQLAAELGKTLLERNKELEASLKSHQNIIDDQAQEIEYLTKQTAALREVNDSRLRIYEQLEVSIQDLERANQRLALENSTDKKHIKNLCVNIDTLESKCEELQGNVQDLSSQLGVKDKRSNLPKSPITPTVQQKNGSSPREVSTIGAVQDEEVKSLLVQLQDLRAQRSREQSKVAALEDQLTATIQENTSLEEQLILLKQKQDEMCSLAEVGPGQSYICARCLKKVCYEDDDMSVVNSSTSETHRSTVMMQIWDSPDEDASQDNPYQTLVEKYEALLRMQQNTPVKQVAPSVDNCLSLEEELRQSGDFNSFNGKNYNETNSEVPENREENGKNNVFGKNRQQKAFSATPTEFSEAETFSSGFSDETINKSTQTDGNLPPGSFLLSIADGDDCKFSIYDEISPVESRFRKTPEYRQLFREIFAVLKRAAEAKADNEQLQLQLRAENAHTPVATPTETLPTSANKLVNGEEKTPPSKVCQHTPLESTAYRDSSEAQNNQCKRKSPHKETILKEESASSFSSPPASVSSQSIKSESQQKFERDILKPKHDILEYLSIGVAIRKKSNSRKNSPSKGNKSGERVERLESMSAVGSCVAKLQASRMSQGGAGRKRRETRIFENQSYKDRSQQKVESWDFQPFVSSASQEVAKLKRLEKSYAEVLRLGPKKPTNRGTMMNSYRN
ncbi:unnamed protein product [Timema podura]|uniref:Cerebellar degeneration-related protein 2 n=1 Tax=Timema podura TaxID=61482 RepID=A0ABN7NP68_TIMPD|nr:unnamed protein product [Timema podura]